MQVIRHEQRLKEMPHIPRLKDLRMSEKKTPPSAYWRTLSNRNIS